ncbi:unnamed protein product, partial [Choristocarpus tenellus]
MPSESQTLQELSKRVFMVLLRLVGREITALKVKHHTDAITSVELLGLSGFFTAAVVLDICALYGRSNASLVDKLLCSLRSVMEVDLGAKLADGLGEAFVVAANTLRNIYIKVWLSRVCLCLVLTQHMYLLRRREGEILQTSEAYGRVRVNALSCIVISIAVEFILERDLPIDCTVLLFSTIRMTNTGL